MTDEDLRDISGVPVAARLIRTVLGVGAVVFVLLGVALVISPTRVAGWIGLAGSVDTAWALQFAGAGLIGLAGQMWLVRRAPDHPILGSAAVMVVSSALTLVLMLTLPGGWPTLRWVMVGIVAVFALAYLLLLLLSRRRA